MDLNSVGGLINTTTFPIAMVIVILLGGYKLFNKYVAPLIISCIDSNKQFVEALEKMNDRLDSLDTRVENIEGKLK